MKDESKKAVSFQLEILNYFHIKPGLEDVFV